MKKFDLTLYLVTDRTNKTDLQFLDIIAKACYSGVTLVQLREKNLGGKELFDLAIAVKKITDKYSVPLIIDDRADIAMAVDAAGVHVGAADLPIACARKILGKNKIVGATAKTVEAAQTAKKDGADYLGVGAIYPTTTKVVTQLTKVETFNDIAAKTNLPCVAIGGLNTDNLDILKNSKASGIAVVSAIMQSDNVEKTVKELREK
ncbi:MAG: thiamine phosphate synthase, partial [Firmicutes bacterium]|nr:thiamine phosphate synthase [Bacillota bacterium]